MHFLAAYSVQVRFGLLFCALSVSVLILRARQIPSLAIWAVPLRKQPLASRWGGWLCALFIPVPGASTPTRPLANVPGTRPRLGSLYQLPPLWKAPGVAGEESAGVASASRSLSRPARFALTKMGVAGEYLMDPKGQIEHIAHFTTQLSA